MNTNLIKTLLLAVGMMATGTAVADDTVELLQMSGGNALLRPREAHPYLLLPVQESVDECSIDVLQDGGQKVETINVRLAKNHVDYYVPYAIKAGQQLLIHHRFVAPTGRNRLHSDITKPIWMEKVTMSDSFDRTNTETLWRPAFHFTPDYGWMNDPNGMVYVNGEYHLFFQYNPYGSMWGNMTWGHAVSRDLTHWQHLPNAITSDEVGAVFSGSCVVDKEGVAGFGKGAIVAFYTSAGDAQSQSVAYSTDGGRNFVKYKGNPVLTSLKVDFRDPKVFWHEGSKAWKMVLAVGQEMQFFTSKDLLHWEFSGNFGYGYGGHNGVWECPDLIELPVRGGKKGETRWVLICNINPGGPAGGSATQYFVGQFDGRTFTCESQPSTTKWMDWGKDHYAAVTWSNQPDGRHTSIAWMSNWQYAGVVPTMQYRSAMSLPRELFLYRNATGDIMLGNEPAPEVAAMRGEQVITTATEIDLPADGICEIEMTLSVKSRKTVLTLSNDAGEQVHLTYDSEARTFAMDRLFSAEEINSDFITETVAPNVSGKTLALRLFVDRSSIEAFLNGGEVSMTNVYFPTKPFTRLSIGDKATAKTTIYNLK